MFTKKTEVARTCALITAAVQARQSCRMAQRHASTPHAEVYVYTSLQEDMKYRDSALMHIKTIPLFVTLFIFSRAACIVDIYRLIITIIHKIDTT